MSNSPPKPGAGMEQKAQELPCTSTGMEKEAQQQNGSYRRNKNKAKKKNRTGNKEGEEEETNDTQAVNEQTTVQTTETLAKAWSYDSCVRAINMIFQPRSFTRLESEKGAIVASLHEHDVAAMEHLGQFQSVDDQLRNKAVPPGEVTQAISHREELRGLIQQGVDQERHLLARLGEIQVEIQCQDRWQRLRGGPILASNGPYPASSWNYGNNGHNMPPGGDFAGPPAPPAPPQQQNCAGPAYNYNQFPGPYGNYSQPQQQPYPPSNHSRHQMMGQGPGYRPQYQRTTPSFHRPPY